MKSYSYDEALAASIEYYHGDELAAKVFVDKYALRNKDERLVEKTPEDMHWRIAKEFARIEKKKFKDPLTAEAIFELLHRFKYLIPQGSAMFGIGNNLQTISLSNCYVVTPPQDSYGSILRTDQQLAQISKRRGGTGADLSHLRPNGAVVKNAARTSTGIPAWMERYSNTIREVGQAGRRGALMLTLAVEHYESDVFATIKNDATKVTGANISLRLSDAFLSAVEKDKPFTLKWPINGEPKLTKEVQARELWKKIIHSAWLRAEPGLLFWDRIINYNAVDCYAKFGFNTVSTNPCSELPLCEHDSCRLLVINLLSFVNEAFSSNAKFDFALFIRLAKIAQRLMDDLIDLELEKIEAIIDKIQCDPEASDIKAEELQLWNNIHEKCQQGRRTGLGIVGLADMLAALNIKYGSKESIEFVEKVHRTMKHASYESSMEMAAELGPFPIWDWELEKNSEFLLQIKEENAALYWAIKKHGRRNIANLTVAPTGSVALVAQVSSGIEPLFRLEPYIRRKKVNPNDKNARIDFVDPSGDSWQNFEVYHPTVNLWRQLTGQKDLAKSPWAGCCAEDLDWTARVKLQAAAQRHIDHAISSTINLPETATEADVAKIYETAWKAGCKGITVYRNNCRTGVLVDKESKPVDSAWLPQTQAPKRPPTLPADVFLVHVKGVEHYVVVGLLGFRPYEVFTGLNEDKKGKFIPKSAVTGEVTKITRGRYELKAVNDEHSYILNNGHSDETVDALTRMISTALRHGADLSFVVQQLEKTTGDMTTFAKAVARTLKKYIEDGTKVHGAACESCGSEELKRESGCVTCPSCGWSKCS
ncbi:MAG: adenosylcobalamin-dependent ribonucleoside-diphosphate reductase [Nitrosomonadaceae bacterium]|nr:adenosylcobalamin-dependent ribonucleoside-diphosphate reductase [Nitrosomonadaceae bacterium]